MAQMPPPPRVTRRETWLSALELEPGATLAEIVDAYRQLVQVWHPDRFAHNPALQQRSQEKLKQINEAYAALKEVAIGNQILEIRAHFITVDEGRARAAGQVADRGSRRQHRRLQRRTATAWVSVVRSVWRRCAAGLSRNTPLTFRAR